MRRTRSAQDPEEPFKPYRQRQTEKEGVDNATLPAFLISSLAAVGHLQDVIKRVGSAIIGGAFNGNARGLNALDFQTHRSAATQVAAGANAIAIGSENTAATDNTIAIGHNNTASSGNPLHGGVAIGADNSALSEDAVAMGANCVAGSLRTVAIGDTAIASDDFALAIGTLATAGGPQSIAIGCGAHTHLLEEDSTAIGLDAATSASHQTVLGGPGVTETIIRGNVTLPTANATVDGVDVSAHAGDTVHHHDKAHDILGADHTITGGAALDLVGQSAANTIARVTPSAAPGAAAKVLASTAAGLLTLKALTVSDAATAWGPVLSITSSNPDATSGALELYKDSASPAASDYIGQVTFEAKDSGNTKSRIADIDVYAPALTAGAEDGVMYFRVAVASTSYEHFRIQKRALCIGTVLDPSADGRTQVRTYGLVGGSVMWDYNGLDGTARTIISHDAEDVVSCALIHFVIKPSTGAGVSGTLTLTPNTNGLLYNVGSDTVTLYVATAGGITVARTGGTMTYKVILQILWL